MSQEEAQPDQSPPELIAYRIHKYPSMPIVPAGSMREWMDQTNARFAYRCLPLLIANQCGWFILNTHHFRCVWNGGPGEHDLKVIIKAGPQNIPAPAMSHFGHGVLTFNLNYLFRTPPGYNLWARGPANLPKDGATALEGIIETDWAVATFTMNWKITTPNLPVEFHPGEPICQILPIKRGEVESFHPKVRDITTEPQLSQAYEAWSRSRSQFNRDLGVPNTQANEELWQKEYMQGYGPNDIKAPEHQTRLKVREFELPQKPPPPTATK